MRALLQLAARSNAEIPCALVAVVQRVTDRDDGLICVVAEVGDVWALERAGAFKGRYHVLGGVLSALDGVRPEDLRIPKLIERASTTGVREVILALSATVDGQTTAHYLAERLQPLGHRHQPAFAWRARRRRTRSARRRHAVRRACKAGVRRRNPLASCVRRAR